MRVLGGALLLGIIRYTFYVPKTREFKTNIQDNIAPPKYTG